MSARMLGWTLAAGLLTSGCGAELSQQEASAAAVAFVQAEPAQACQQLAPETRKSTEVESKADCAQALAELELGSDTTVQSVEVAGESGQVRFSDQVIFLARFPDGWLVTAAGCQRTDADPAVPYDCEVEA